MKMCSDRQSPEGGGREPTRVSSDGASLGKDITAAGRQFHLKMS